MSVLISALIAQAWSCAIRERIPVGSKHRKIHMGVGSLWEFAPCPGMFSCIWKFITLFHNCTSFCLVCVTPPANSWGPIKDGGDSVCVCVCRWMSYTRPSASRAVSERVPSGWSRPFRPRPPPKAPKRVSRRLIVGTRNTPRYSELSAADS